MAAKLKHMIAGVAAALTAVTVVPAAAAQADPAKNFPNKPVRLIGPFTPGAGTDTTARLIAKHLSDLWNQQVVVDNRTGAAGAIGVDLTAKAQPDGYTICLISASLHVNSATNPNLPYDLTKDLQGISLATSLFYVMYINPSVPAKSVQDLIAFARAHPGKLNYSSSGTGGLQHMAGELFDYMAKTRMTHVPFKGTAAGVVANLSGEVQVGFGTLFGVRPHMQTGKLRGLAITATKRSAAVDLPTVSESGVPGYSVDQMYGIIGSAKIPKPIINKINAGVVSAMKDPETVKKLTADGSVPVGSTPEEYTRIIREEVEKWRKVAKAAGLKLH
ncbi:MAG: tripartite tricarboxylate transporter substrate binding protein [Betaproteobacteria bacterium]|jgi:tripartite-type tricarboxylate transporter receptor subunit TctC|nr:tripartite tricarboxylate transporter substrate binding protein [Betaproteobacteria bacterium]